jgi:hypothetical protein
MEVLLEVVKQNVSIAPDAATLIAAKRMGFSLAVELMLMLPSPTLLSNYSRVVCSWRMKES